MRQLQNRNSKILHRPLRATNAILHCTYKLKKYYRVVIVYELLQDKLFQYLKRVRFNLLENRQGKFLSCVHQIVVKPMT